MQSEFNRQYIVSVKRSHYLEDILREDIMASFTKQFGSKLSIFTSPAIRPNHSLSILNSNVPFISFVGEIFFQH